jgi:micrococcal nuclease
VAVAYYKFDNFSPTKTPKKNIMILWVLLLSFIITPALAHAKPFGDYEGAIYIRNYDGDTITFNLPGLHPIIGEKISIRVNDIDTPEIRGKCEKEKYNAQQAKDMVADILRDAEQMILP